MKIAKHENSSILFLEGVEVGSEVEMLVIPWYLQSNAHDMLPLVKADAVCLASRTWLSVTFMVF